MFYLVLDLPLNPPEPSYVLQFPALVAEVTCGLPVAEVPYLEARKDRVVRRKNNVKE